MSSWVIFCQRVVYSRGKDSKWPSNEKTWVPCTYIKRVFFFCFVFFVFFFAVVFTYQGLLLLFGIFLAWETRNVTIPTLNDSKYIGMSAVYNVFVSSIIGSVASLTLEYYDASYAILFMCLIMSTSLTMLLVFAPKVRILWLETSHEWPGENLSLQYQYSIRQTSDENIKETIN